MYLCVRIPLGVEDDAEVSHSTATLRYLVSIKSHFHNTYLSREKDAIKHLPDSAMYSNRGVMVEVRSLILEETLP